MQELPEDHLESDDESDNGDSRKRIVRRVVKPGQNQPAAQPSSLISPEEKTTTPETQDVPEPEVNSIFICLECSTPVPLGLERCPKCGTAYAKDEITVETQAAEIDAQLALDDTFEDFSQLFDQEEVGCGYFDVDDGIVAYVEPREEGNMNKIFECLNCKTIIEFDAGRCPLCNEPLKKIESGLVEIVNGVIVGGDLDMEDSRGVFCPVCGDLLMLDNGHCIICEAKLVSPSDEELSCLCPVVPSRNLVFLHLDVENGDLNYISNSEGPSCQEAVEPPAEDSFDVDALNKGDDPENNR